MGDLDFDQETAALEGHLLARADALLTEAIIVIAANEQDNVTLPAEMVRWRANYVQLVRRWRAAR